MVVNKDKKVDRYRGSKTHGGGSKKKRRGAGSRGGVGMAGTGKRADTNKPSIWKDKKYFGRHGFVRQNAKTIKSINIGYLDYNLESFKDKVTITKDQVEIDLKKLGYDKLLGGRVDKLDKKYVIKAESASRKAIERIEAAGGKVILPETGLKG
jgi:large subunit ribosomal protein L15